MLEKGRQIGPYRVVRLLGKGGMAEVYEVENERLGARFALKAFTLDHGEVEFLRKRFHVEGRLLARLSHPRIVRVYDMDVDADSARWRSANCGSSARECPYWRRNERIPRDSRHASRQARRSGDGRGRGELGALRRECK